MRYGKDDGYWDGEKLIAQLKDIAIPALKNAHPGCQLLFIFDNSSGHSVYAPDALSAAKKAINLGPGGKNTKLMRDGWVVDEQGNKHLFPMNIIFPDGTRVLRGIKSTLEARSLWRVGLKLECTRRKNISEEEEIEVGGNEHPCRGRKDCCARTILRNQPDFLAQRTAIEEAVEEAGELCLFLPKYHCELNIIEFFWGATKRWTREHCDYSINGLLHNIPIGQDKVSIFTIRRWYTRMMRWVKAYEEGKNSVEAQEIVRKFTEVKRKHHRRIGDNDNIQ
jgi:hypothetical protein